MRVTVEFEENGNKYKVDFLRLAKILNITEEQVKMAVNDLLSKNV